MDTLTTSLLVLILIALAIVLTFNLLQGRQIRLRDAWREKLAGDRPPAAPAARAPVAAKPTAGRSEPTVGEASSGDRAATGGRVEPTLGATPPPVEPSDDGVDAEPGATPAPVTPASHRTAAAPGEVTAELTPESPGPARDDATGPVLDPRLDCIVAFALPAPVGVERLLSAASALRRAGSKPIAVEVDAGDGRWSVPHASLGALRRVRAGVLLANRHSALNAMEFSEFGNAVQALGRAIGARDAVLPDMGAVLEHARQLFDAGAQLDAAIGLNVLTPTALSPDELAALALGLGLQERGNNRFTAVGEEGEVLFSLALGDRAELLSLLLDVPRAPEHAEPWQRMLDCARHCADRTGGRVVDDAGRPLSAADIAEITRQLMLRYQTLSEAGLDAGSVPALRVFN
jgi:hypothetical protein